MQFKYIKASEWEKLQFTPRAGKIKTAERLAIEAMKPNVLAIIDPKQWTLKSEPNHITHSVGLRDCKKFKARRLLQGGWAVMRVK